MRLNVEFRLDWAQIFLPYNDVHILQHTHYSILYNGIKVRGELQTTTKNQLISEILPLVPVNQVKF